MLKLFALIATACLFACSSASGAAPKATNPPVAKPAPPADGAWTLSFDQLGCAMTMPHHRWKPKLMTEADGGTLMKADLEGTSVTLFLKAYMNDDGTPLKQLAETDRQLFAGDPSFVTTDLQDDGDGRWVFMLDAKRDDGSTLRGSIYTVPSPDGTNRYLSIAVIGQAADYDRVAQEAHDIVKSLRPLSK